MRQICFLNMFGDITISWDKKDDKMMYELIQQKLDNGYTFFKVESSLFGLRKKEIEVTSLGDITDRTVLVKDKDMENIFLNIKSIKTIKNKESSFSVKGVVKTAKEICKSNCICIKPAVGG